MKISLIIPVLNEAGVLEQSLRKLEWMRQLGHEIIVVDGGSRDQSMSLAEPLADHVLLSAPGRAVQMNVGASLATGDIFLFLHVDTFLPKDSAEAIVSSAAESPDTWGRFDVRLSGEHFLFRVIERMMNWRSRITGIATGDQAMFVSRDMFKQLGGFPEIALMEDIEMSCRLKKISRPVCLPQTVITSSRRWEQGGVFKTIGLMWRLRFAYWLGVDPAQLARRYR